jgi:hypothetical protein
VVFFIYHLLSTFELLWKLSFACVVNLTYSQTTVVNLGKRASSAAAAGPKLKKKKIQKKIVPIPKVIEEEEDSDVEEEVDSGFFLHLFW